MEEYNRKISSQYGDGNIKRRIDLALMSSNRDADTLTLEDLAHIDELHIGGREATIRLASSAKIFSGAKVLDAGSGLGGPARVLASKFDCIVSGIDMTEEFCDVATMLTKLAGIDYKKVSFICGNALNMPFKDEYFDMVWSQHSSMNIEDKKSLYSEYKRVLKKGGLVVIHDVVTNPDTSLYYPVPWANEPSVSFLITLRELTGILTDLNFKKLHIRDLSEDAVKWYEKMREARKSGDIPILGPNLVFGPVISSMASNMKRNLIENRAKIIETIWRK